MAGTRAKARKTGPLTGKPGVVYKPSRERLYVFNRKAIVVVSGGPRPQAWRKTIDRGWHGVRPAIPHDSVHLSLPESEGGRHWYLIDGLRAKAGQYLFPFMEDVRDACYGDRAWVAWLRGLDVESRRAVASFRDRVWHLLTLALRCPGATDLMQSSPALAFALASSWVFRGERRVRRPLRSARSLLRKRQRLIADWLGFPGTESAVRILRRVPHQTIGIETLLYLRDAMRTEVAARLLRHVPNINADVIRIVSSDDLLRHASPRLVIEAGLEAGPDEMPVWRIMRDTIAMFRRMGQDPAGLVFRSREHLYAIHDEAVELLNRIGGYRGGMVLEIPPPPLEGTASIEPLTRISDFLREGREQHNCVAVFAERVALSAADFYHHRPSLYVYRVLWPERATLSIIRRGDQWAIDELRCAHNQPPASETVGMVRDWLCDARPRTGRPEYDETLIEYPAWIGQDVDEECCVPF